MIFDVLFRPKSRHPDPKVRRQAIEALSESVPEHKSQLHELAFNDESLDVRLAALRKLDRFSLWWKLAETDRHPEVRQVAFEVVEKELLSDQLIRLNAADRQRFIDECNNQSFLEKIARKSSDRELVLDILQRLNKPKLERQIFFATDDEQLQLALLQRMSDVKSLSRVLKKVSHPAVKASAEEKLAQLHIQQAKEEHAQQQGKLIVAKLAALLDEADYQKLTEQLSRLKEEFGLLTEEAGDLPVELSEKFEHLLRKASDRQSKLYPSFLVNKEKEFTKQRHQLVIEQATTLANTLESQLQTNPDGIESQTALQRIETSLDSIGAVEDQSTNSLAQHLYTLQQKLNALPQIRQVRNDAQFLIEQLSSLARPETIEQWQVVKEQVSDIKRQWHNSVAIVKEDWLGNIAERWRMTNAQWKSHVEQLESQTEEKLSEFKSQFRKLDQLIQAGKYHTALSVFDRVNDKIAKLPEGLQKRLDRQVSKVAVKIEELKSLQAYLAESRKPKMLEQLTALSEQTNSMVELQRRLNDLRKQWRDLGQYDTELDTQLNHDFAEQCQFLQQKIDQHFALLKEENERHIEQRREVIHSLTSMSETFDIVELPKRLAMIEKRWQACGRVPSAQWSKLLADYQVAKKPHRQRLKALQQENLRAKQALIDEAESLVTSDLLLTEQISQIKALQKQWKQLGYAGKADNSQLWKKFKAQADAIFQRREQALQQQAQQDKAINGKLFELMSGPIVSIAQWKELDTEVNELLAELSDSKQQEWIEKLANKKAELEKSQRVARYQKTLSQLSLLEQFIEDPVRLGEGINSLPKLWKTAIQPDDGISKDPQAFATKLLLQCNANIDGLDPVMVEKAKITLLNEKLNQSAVMPVEETFEQWLLAGGALEADKKLALTVVRHYAEYLSNN